MRMRRCGARAGARGQGGVGVGSRLARMAPHGARALSGGHRCRCAGRAGLGCRPHGVAGLWVSLRTAWQALGGWAPDAHGASTAVAAACCARWGTRLVGECIRGGSAGLPTPSVHAGRTCTAACLPWHCAHLPYIHRTLPARGRFLRHTRPRPPPPRFYYDGLAPSGGALLAACEARAAAGEEFLGLDSFGPLPPEAARPLLPIACALALLPAKCRHLAAPCVRHLMPRHGGGSDAGSAEDGGEGADGGSDDGDSDAGEARWAASQCLRVVVCALGLGAHKGCVSGGGGWGGGAGGALRRPAAREGVVYLVLKAALAAAGGRAPSIRGACVGAWALSLPACGAVRQAWANAFRASNQ